MWWQHDSVKGYKISLPRASAVLFGLHAIRTIKLYWESAVHVVSDHVVPLKSIWVKYSLVTFAQKVYIVAVFVLKLCLKKDDWKTTSVKIK